jgi:hypothetical protein
MSTHLRTLTRGTPPPRVYKFAEPNKPVGVCVPEDLKTLITRIFEHAKKQVELLEDALANEDYDTADFLASVAVMDLTYLRSVINSLLRFSPRKSS